MCELCSNIDVCMREASLEQRKKGLERIIGILLNNIKRCYRYFTFTDQQYKSLALLLIMYYICMYLRTKETNYPNFVKVFIWEQI